MSTGLVHPSGIDLDDIFEVTGTGTQQTNILCYDSQDIGSRYRAGTTNISDTGFRIASGVDVKNLFGGSGVGIYRPSCISWNGHVVGHGESNDTTKQFWEDWVERWTNRPRDATCVSNVMNDCIYRGTHSDTKPTSVLFAYTPFRTGTLSFTVTKGAQGIWHNSWCNMEIWPFELDAYCKGVILKGTAGAGGGVKAVINATLTVSGYGTMQYRGMYGIDNDSNKEHTGTSNWSPQDFDGKTWVFYNG